MIGPAGPFLRSARSFLRTNDAFLGFLFLLLVVERTMVLLSFGIVYTGGDDTILWQGAEDYSKFIFHEPFFYGQNYGFMLEALLAAPLLHLGLAHHVALPLVTELLTLLPFLWPAWMLRKQGEVLGAAVCLLVPLAMSVEYGMLTGMSRGFVTGLAVGAPLFAVVMDPTPARRTVLFSVVSSFSLVANPNAFPLVLLVGMYLLQQAPIRPLVLALAALCAMPAFMLQHWARAFYEEHPDHLAHWMVDLEFDPSAALDALQDLGRYFGHLFPVLWGAGWIWVLLVPAIGVLVWWHDRAWGISLILTSVTAILLIGVNKVRDGVDSLFHTQQRMFLSVPVITAYALAWTSVVRPLKTVSWKPTLLAVALVIVGVKNGVYRTVIDRHAKKEDQGPVVVMPVDKAKEECRKIAAFAAVAKAEVVVFAPDWKFSTGSMSLRSCACPLLESELPTTFLTIGERRTWVYREVMASRPGTVMVFGHMVGDGADLDGQGIDALRPTTELLVVRNNTLLLPELLHALGVAVRRHPYAPDASELPPASATKQRLSSLRPPHER